MSQLQTNIVNLQSILDSINALPEGNSGSTNPEGNSSPTKSITVDFSGDEEWVTRVMYVDEFNQLQEVYGAGDTVEFSALGGAIVVDGFADIYYSQTDYVSLYYDGQREFLIKITDTDSPIQPITTGSQ